LLSIFSIIPFITSTTIPLSHYHTNLSPSPSPFSYTYQNLINLVSSSLSRAHHLKNSKSRTTTTTTTETQLFSHSYGGYSIFLSFGTPPQTLPFIMDTGSDLVWFPCTHRYLCKNCSSSTSSSTPSFIPKQSSSSKILGCLNPKCSWIHHQNPQCRDCVDPNSRNCTQICPPYLILYGSGTTGGIALTETMDLPNRIIPNFLVGCSVFSSHQPSGIAGLGRGPASLPTQLGLDKFSYCLLSHKFDDTSRFSSLMLHSHLDSGHKTTGVSYTPFIKNPTVPSKEAFSVYYYVSLREISVGGRRLHIPYRFLKPQSDGDGGTIIDSGTTFTFMAHQVFESLATEFETQVDKYHKRAHDVELLTGLRPCFNVSGAKTFLFPEIRLHFKGGAELALPVENYLAVVDDGGGVCMTVVTDGAAGTEVAAAGPGIILGNFQMQNFYVEYDLRNERFGFRQQLC
ncbi:Asp domain-containing protein, partial [Cephalotus follicularis]